MLSAAKCRLMRSVSKNIKYMRIPAHLVVSDGVNDGVDAAVEEHHDDGEVVEGACEVDVRVPEVVHQVVRLVPRPAEYEEQRNGRQCLDHVRSGSNHIVIASLQPCTHV